jgi:large subunit ribosomal protein L18
MVQESRQQARRRRKVRVRKRIRGTAERPRLNVFRSAIHIYAQIIDDTSGRTLVSSSDRDASVVSQKAITKVDRASLVGKSIAERAQANGIETIVFDRAGYQYHGRVKAVADAAREAGLEF